jgi:glycosyltransferase involved in cell wall biosynthesis
VRFRRSWVNLVGYGPREISACVQMTEGLTSSGGSPKVSVVVPVYNGGREIARTVERILAQSLTPHEVIVVDDGSTDDTPEVLKKLGGRVTYLRQENAGPASARNRGVGAATGDFVAFTDSDCAPDTEWLSNLLKGFEDGRVAGVGGTVRGVNRGLMSEYADVLRLYDPGRGDAGEVVYVATCNACFRREVLVEAGLFDERFRKPGGEEPELCMRIRERGYELRAAADALVLHRNKTFRQLLRAQSNYCEGAYVIGVIRPEHRWRGSSRRGLVASALSLFLVFTKSSSYRREHGLLKALAFAAVDQVRAVACTWGYMRGERLHRKGALRLQRG